MNAYAEKVADFEYMQRQALGWLLSYRKTGYAPYMGPALRLYTRAQAVKASALELPLWRVL